MGKRKLIMGVLVVLIVILCMITIYLQNQNNKWRISYNRADREYEMLNKDYEKLYGAYYSYDKKVLKILKFLDRVYWAEDSSAFLLYDGKETALFSFYKKPRMDGEYFLWAYGIGITETNVDTTYATMNLEGLNWRVDTLRPHNYLLFQTPVLLTNPFVSPKSKKSLLPDYGKIVTSIKIN